MLLNIGFMEALKLEPQSWDCFIFHDVDLLPLNDLNLYTCPTTAPRHMSVAVDSMAYRCCAFTPQLSLGQLGLLASAEWEMSSSLRATRLIEIGHNLNAMCVQ